MQQRVGFIGLGAIGKPMAENILKKGFPLSLVKGRAVKSVEALVHQGAAAFDTPSQVAGSTDVLILMVPSSREVEELVYGDNGILEAAPKGLTVIDMGTSHPASTRRIAAAFAEHGIDFLDSPVTRGVRGAIAGNLALMVGGEKEVLERCRPVLSAMASDIFHVGPVAMGHVFKLINQLIVLVTLGAVAEGFALAEAEGADLELLFEVLGSGAARSYVLETQVPDMLKQDFTPRFATKLALKDLRLALDLATAADRPLPISALVTQMFHTGMQWGLGDLNESAIIKVWQTMMSSGKSQD